MGYWEPPRDGMVGAIGMPSIHQEGLLGSMRPYWSAQAPFGNWIEAQASVYCPCSLETCLTGSPGERLSS